MPPPHLTPAGNLLFPFPKGPVQAVGGGSWLHILPRPPPPPGLPPGIPAGQPPPPPGSPPTAAAHLTAQVVSHVESLDFLMVDADAPVPLPAPVLALPPPPEPPGILRWRRFISPRMPLLTYGAVTELAEGLLAQGFLSDTMFMAMPRPSLPQLFVEWTGPHSTELLDRVSNLYELRSIPAATTPNLAPSPERTLGPAEIVAGAFRISVFVRSSAIVSAMLGLQPGQPLPTPNAIMRLLKSSPHFLKARSEGMVIEALMPLVEQRILEALAPGSRKSYLSGIHSWIHFCDLIDLPTTRQLLPTEAEVCGWLSLMRQPSTAASYCSHLKAACILADTSVAWHGARVRKVISGVRKEATHGGLFRFKWACRRSQMILLIGWASTRPGYQWFHLMLVLAYNFQLRVFSELFAVLLEDCVIDRPSEPLGHQSLTLFLNRRKNQQYRHPLCRHCSCTRTIQNDARTPGAIFCPVHVFLSCYPLLPSGRMEQAGQSSGMRLMHGIPISQVNPTLKEASRDTGDPHWSSASSHGPRRGAGCDLAKEGGNLGEILAAGDWRSSAFKTYLASVEKDLAGDAILGLLGETSDSDLEED